MDVQDMRIFARVAAVQNLSLVGHEMSLTPGTISKRIQALEDDLGAKLFQRNTRSIHITEEGQKLLKYVERILQDIEGARAAVAANRERPRGKLRVAAPTGLGRVRLAPAICKFMEDQREIDIQLDLTDRQINQEDGYDIIIRRGMPPSSGLIRKALSLDPLLVVASPKYLQENGEPHAPEELANHSCLVPGDGANWEFLRDGVKVSVRVSGRFRSDNSELLRYAARSGLGIMRISAARARESIDKGFLRHILRPYEVAVDSTIYALYPSTSHVLPKLRVFLDFLADWFSEARGSAAMTAAERESRAVAGTRSLQAVSGR